MNNQQDNLALSSYTEVLLQYVNNFKKKTVPHDAAIISVSQTVSFFAFLYEKVRNAVEFREEHLIRRAAIERIIKRRFMLNPDGRGEGENLARELLWARYLPNTNLTEQDATAIQLIINKYLDLKKRVMAGRNSNTRILFARYLMDFLTCEIEEGLHEDVAQKKSAFLYFFYQVLKNKVVIKELSENQKNVFFYVACEAGFAKNDNSYIRYHLFRLSHKSILSHTDEEIEILASNFPTIVHNIEKTVNNLFHQRLLKFVHKQMPPFAILFTIIERNLQELTKTLTGKTELWKKLDLICREKYQETGKKLQRAAIRSIIYIFLTKMVFILILEYPLSFYFYKEALLMPLAVNGLFPPFLMALIISFVTVPSEKNTKKIFNRVVDILDKDSSFETNKTLVAKNQPSKRPILIFGFTVFYLFTFGVTFALIYYGLDYLHFNLISRAIFIFFLTVVTFFAYRIRQTANEYTLEEKQNILSPIIDFFFMPIVSVGKLLSQGIAKVNIFILIFDFLIEAPFKLIFEIVEEWINFVKARKEEII